MENKDVVGALKIAVAVGDTIRELGSVPSGELYSRVMGHMDVHSFEKIITALVGAGLVRQHNFLLTWIGPAAKPEGAGK